MLRPAALLLYFVPMAVIAFLSTLASGSIGSLSGWGFPLQWKVGGCTTINGGLTCAEEFHNLPFFALDVLFYALLGYGLLFVADALVPSLINRVVVLDPLSILSVVLIATAVTLATGFLGSGQLFNPGGVSSQIYGFPLQWKTSSSSCPPPCVQANGTTYDWILFTGDLLFYASTGYALLLRPFSHPNQPRKFKIRLESGRVLGILTLAVIGLSVGNYAYDSAYGTGNHWIGAGLLQLDHYSFQDTNQLTVWLKDLGPGSATVTDIYVSNGNGSGPVASYTVNLTIGEGSLGMISENTTSQGLQLSRSSTYRLQVNNAFRQITFTVTWT